ncbi:hypothetical protein DHEL01_v203093 [Diaporthe helianthi]|uniref:Uncharacterized protein n=1 Tax=Diaporthe helianthi TaxID=158607 RepID=A0A2P5I7M7_DIAHE|nr:hypothetical protein DHEL01_v203093 [Diaporthe helianthi]
MKDSVHRVPVPSQALGHLYARAARLLLVGLRRHRGVWLSHEPHTSESGENGAEGMGNQELVLPPAKWGKIEARSTSGRRKEFGAKVKKRNGAAVKQSRRESDRLKLLVFGFRELRLGSRREAFVRLPGIPTLSLPGMELLKAQGLRLASRLPTKLRPVVRQEPLELVLLLARKGRHRIQIPRLGQRGRLLSSEPQGRAVVPAARPRQMHSRTVSRSLPASKCLSASLWKPT